MERSMGQVVYTNYPVNVGPGGFVPGAYPVTYPSAFPVVETAGIPYGRELLLVGAGVAAALIISSLLK